MGSTQAKESAGGASSDSRPTSANEARASDKSIVAQSRWNQLGLSQLSPPSARQIARADAGERANKSQPSRSGGSGGAQTMILPLCPFIIMIIFDIFCLSQRALNGAAGMLAEAKRPPDSIGSQWRPNDLAGRLGARPARLRANLHSGDTIAPLASAPTWRSSCATHIRLFVPPMSARQSSGRQVSAARLYRPPVRPPRRHGRRARRARRSRFGRKNDHVRTVKTWPLI